MWRSYLFPWSTRSMAWKTNMNPPFTSQTVCFIFCSWIVIAFVSCCCCFKVKIILQECSAPFFYDYFLLLMLQLWLSSQRDQLHNSLIPVLSQTCSLWVQQKQSLQESNTAAPLLGCMVPHYSTRTHTHPHTDTAHGIQVVNDQKGNLCFFLCLFFLI